MRWSRLALIPFLCGALYFIDWDREIRYVAIGDSYSIGEGVKPSQSWPSLLARELNQNGTKTRLILNLSKTGWTTLDTLEKELPKVAPARPDFVTLQVGVNDWARGVGSVEFRERLGLLIDKTQALLEDPKKLLLVNIPDFSVAVRVRRSGDPEVCSRGIASFNKIIAEEAAKRQLAVVDVFTLTQSMGIDPTRVAEDGLHPSAKEYIDWVKLILPTAQKLLVR